VLKCPDVKHDAWKDLFMGTSINYKRVTTRGAIRPFMAESGGTPLKFLIFSGPLILLPIIYIMFITGKIGFLGGGALALNEAAGMPPIIPPYSNL